MNHRQHKAMRFEKLLWIIKESEDIDFLSNKYISSKGRDFKHVLALELPQLYHVVKELSNKR